MEALHTLEYGTQGSRVVFCHGLFGQGRNWTTIARALADDHRVTLLDLPNHGRSGWTDRIDYFVMADAVAELLSAADPVSLVGHSMGGKVAMVLALRRPDLVERLCVVDIAPRIYPRGAEFRGYIDGMLGIDLEAITSRADAEAAMRQVTAAPDVRAFLLQNLRREGSSWRWQVNLEVIGRDLDVLGDWPEGLTSYKPYEGPTLWIAGESSPYIHDEDSPRMRALFPRVKKLTIKGAGHWVHSDQPEVFLAALQNVVDA